MTRRDERELVQRLLAADEDAFSAFFSAYFPRLYRFALARLDGDPEAAGEVAQVTLCRVVDRLHTYRGEAPLLTWICSICRRQIADHQRRRRAGPLELLEDSPEVQAALEALAAGTDDPERELHRHQLVRLVHATLDHLPAPYGRALEMRYLDALPVAEVAARLELGYKATESLLSRARAAFRRGFQAVIEGGGPGLAAGRTGS